MPAETPLIPAIIHVLCKDRTAPGLYVERMKALHPGWTFMLYDDKAMEHVVYTLFSNIKEQYFTFPKEIQRRDIFRMLVLGRHGGFYMDADIHCYKALDTLRQHSLVLAEEKTLSGAALLEAHHRYPLRIANYMLGCAPGHPFIEAFIDEALSRCNQPVNSENDVLETTGPGLLTNFYHEQKHLYPDIYLLLNPGLHCLKRCTPQPACHFGDYAAHLHEGSWRWQR